MLKILITFFSLFRLVPGWSLNQYVKESVRPKNHLLDIAKKVCRLKQNGLAKIKRTEKRRSVYTTFLGSGGPQVSRRKCDSPSKYLCSMRPRCSDGRSEGSSLSGSQPVLNDCQDV